MNTEIINIGDEILIGQVVNTNAAWLAGELNLNGFLVNRFTVLPDRREDILRGLEEAATRAGLVLVSGGIGPTTDDITRQTICEFFDTRPVFNDEAYRDIEAFFACRGLTVTGLNRKQAELPEHCITLPNRMGTARGMWFEKGSWVKGQGSSEMEADHQKATSGTETRIQDPISIIYVFLPGVPFEMQDMFTREVIPRLKEKFVPQGIFHKTVLTQGMGESFIADILKEWEEALPAHIRLAYLPQPGIVRLRFTATGTDRSALQQEVESEIIKLHRLIPDLIFGYDDETLEQIVGQLLLEKNQTLAIAESCTGGYISHLITSVPGCSACFSGSVVAYGNRSKVDLLCVKKDTLESYGAVSEQVALEMALGARSRFGSDFAVATTGIAGPTGGTDQKPVGTVWIGIASPAGVFARLFLFGDNRERNIRRTAITALNLLRKELLKQSTSPSRSLSHLG